jgi:hypothetical protein
MASPPGHVSKDAIAEVRRALNDGNEASVGLERLGRFRCEATTPSKFYRPQGGNCPYEAKFQTSIGRKLCQLHAELWAASVAVAHG